MSQGPSLFETLTNAATTSEHRECVPAIREICKMVGVASTSSVYAHLKILEEKGYIARKMDASRAIAIL